MHDRMNPEIKERWVAALRSGDYKQADGYLNVTAAEGVSDEFDGFCCLGVLCELAVADGVIEKQRVGENSFFEYGNPDSDDWDYSLLPETVRNWAGLSENNPSINLTEDPNEDEWVPVSEPNDNGTSFEEIARYIERDL